MLTRAKIFLRTESIAKHFIVALGSFLLLVFSPSVTHAQSLTYIKFLNGSGSTASACTSGSAGLYYDSSASAFKMCVNGGTPYAVLTTNSGVLTGGGTANYIPKYTGGSTLGNSLIYDNGTNVGIGTTGPGEALSVSAPASYYPASFKRAGAVSVYAYSDSGGAGISNASPYTGGILEYLSGTSLKLWGPNNTITFDASSGTGVFSSTVTASAFSGAMSGTMSAANISSGNFGGNTGGGNYSFPSNVGIGTTAPVEKLNLNGGKFVVTSDSGSYGQVQINAPAGGEATIVLGSTGSGVNSGGYTNAGVVGIGAYGNARDTLVLGTGYSSGTMFLKGGNVGIGTASPSFKLDLVGVGSNNVAARLTPDNGRVRYNGVDLLGHSSNNLWVLGNTNSVELNLGTDWDWDKQVAISYAPNTVGSAGGVLSIGQTSKNSTNYTHGITRFVTNGAERMRINESGNVGIGANVPYGRLEVKGGATTFTTSDFQYNMSGSVLGIYPVSSTGNTAFQIGVGNSGDSTRGNLALQPAGGNVGIGTTAPGYKLDVQGGIVNASGGFYWNGSSLDSRYVSATDASIMTGRGSIAEASIDSATSNGYYLLSKSGYSTGLLVFNAGGSTGPFQMDANYYGMLRWRNKTDSSTWQVWRTLISNGGNSISDNYVPKFSNSGYGFIGNSTIYDNGSVGIGTTSPGYKLDVVGDIRAQNSWLRTTGNSGWYSDSYGGGIYMQDSAWIRTYNSKSIWTDSGLLGTNGGLTAGYGGATPPSGGAIIAGSVGIGTTGPSYKLDVASGLSAFGSIGAARRVWLGDVGNPIWGGKAYFGADLGSTEGAIRIGTSYQALSGYANFLIDYSTNSTSNGSDPSGLSYTNAFAIRGDNGSVGIGTVTPGYKLDVIGNIASRSGDNSYTYYGPNSSWAGQLYVGATPNKSTTNTAQVIATDGNLHLDAGSNKDMYLNYYSSGRPIHMYGAVDTNSNFTIGGTGYQRGGYTICDSSNNCGYAPSSSSGNYWGNSGGWMGDLGSYSFSRFLGNAYSGGEISLLTNNSQTSVLVDGSYFSGETNGFYSLNASNQYASRVGFNNSGGYFNINSNVIVNGGSSSNWGALNVNGNIQTNANMYSYGKICSQNASGSCDSTGGTVINGGTVQSWGAHYATMYYDKDDTGYYVDPNSTSRQNRINFTSMYGVNWSPGEPRWDFSAYVVEAQHWYGHNASQVMYLGESNPVYVRGDIRSPIFYDYNDTGYYVDPNSSSNLNIVNASTVNAARFASNQGSQSPDNSHPGYGIRPFYSWNIGCANNGSGSCYSNGITIGSHPGDQSYGFQIVENMWDDQLYFRRYNGGWQGWRTVCDNTNNCGYMTGSASSFRQFNTWQNSHYSGTGGEEYATIFYDANNSGYYVNPDSSSYVYAFYRVYGFNGAEYDANDGNYYVDPNGTTRLNVLNTASTVTVGSGSGKIDVGTVDPPYTIGGKKYATYTSGMTGVKEETTGSVQLKNGRAVLDLKDVKEGGDLWLFAKTANLSAEGLTNVTVLLTPNFDGRTWYKKNASDDTIEIYASEKSGEVSYRLTAPRFDHEGSRFVISATSTYGNVRNASDATEGFNLDKLLKW